MGRWSVFGLGFLVPLFCRMPLKVPGRVTDTVQRGCVIGTRAACWSAHLAGPGGKKPTNNVLPMNRVPLPVKAC